jgi:hypothetical protein
VGVEEVHHGLGGDLATLVLDGYHTKQKPIFGSKHPFLWVIEGNLELSTSDLNGCCLHPLGKVMGRRQTPAVAIPGFSEGSDEVHP